MNNKRISLKQYKLIKKERKVREATNKRTQLINAIVLSADGYDKKRTS